MNCFEFRPVPAILIGIGFGFCIYLFFRCVWARHLPTIPGTLEAGFNGYGLVSGILLVFSVFCPENLVHIVSGRESLDLHEIFGKNGDGTLRHISATIEIGEFIAVDAALGGHALIIACILGLVKVCRDAMDL